MGTLRVLIGRPLRLVALIGAVLLWIAPLMAPLLMSVLVGPYTSVGLF